MTQPGDRGEVPPLTVSRTFAARRAILFRAWSSAEHVSAWFSPATYRVSEARVEMVAGGVFEVCMVSPAGEAHWTRGRFVEVTPEVRLVIDMDVADAAGRLLFHAHIVVTFADAPGGGTVMAVVQSYRFVDPAMAAPMVAGAAEGWRTTLDKLATAVGRMGVQAGSVVHGSFQLERRYEAPIERVWQALTDVAAKQRWFVGPPGEWELVERFMEVRDGGRELVKGRFRSGVVSTFDASYHDVVWGERLVYSYVMHLDERKISVSLATMALQADGGGTRLLVTEQGAFLDGYEDAGSREGGTGYLLDMLGGWLGG